MASRSSDFVRDILQKSILQAIHVYGFLKTPFGIFLDPFGLSDDTQARVPRGSTNHSFCLSQALRLFWDSVALRHLFPTPSDVDFFWFLWILHYLKRNFGPKIHRFCCKTNSENTTLASTTPTSRHDNWRFLAFFATRYSGLFNESCRCPVRNWKTHRRNKQLILFVLKLCTCKFVHTQYG